MMLILLTRHGMTIDRHLTQAQVNRLITIYSEVLQDSRGDVDRLCLEVKDDE